MLEKSLLTYQFFTFGISPRILPYQPGFWHIKYVWRISQDFGISVHIFVQPYFTHPWCDLKSLIAATIPSSLRAHSVVDRGLCQTF